MAEYIEREKAENIFWEEQQKLLEWKRYYQFDKDEKEEYDRLEGCRDKIKTIPTADVVEVVRCKECVHCKQVAPHCEINRYAYFHCELWRGEETNNVWHKYKKYYANYSIVEPNDFCSYGELKEREKV